LRFNPERLLRTPCTANGSTYRPALWPHIQSVFVSGDIFGEVGTQQQRFSCLIEKEDDMSQSKLTRRGFAAAAATGVATIGLLGATGKTADAYQGNMERALSSLYQALGSLRESTANKGGHRAKAMDLVRQAIDETQAGIEFADEHGGGGQ
jgi:hypothetical protein